MSNLTELMVVVIIIAILLSIALFRSTAPIQVGKATQYCSILTTIELQAEHAKTADLQDRLYPESITIDNPLKNPFTGQQIQIQTELLSSCQPPTDENVIKYCINSDRTRYKIVIPQSIKQKIHCNYGFSQ